MRTVAYLRISSRSQDLANQKLAILEFSQKRHITGDRFIESRISSRKSPLERRIDEMLGTLQPGDRLLLSELSRLGRSLSQVIQIVETLVRRKVRFIAIKEAIEFDGKQDLRTKVMIALFGLFAEVERDLISERTKEGLAAAKAKGKLLGRPKGALGTSRLDGKEQDIRALLGKDVSKASIATRRLRQWLCRKHKVRTGKHVRFPSERLWSDYGLTHLAPRTASFPWAKA